MSVERVVLSLTLCVAPCALAPAAGAQSLQGTMAAIITTSAVAGPVGRAPRAPKVVTAEMMTASAASAAVAPVIDGRDDDAVWAEADLIDGFRMFIPTEDGAAGQRTTARLAYDAKNLYVFVRAYDTRPDSIVSLLSRRDVRTPSDWIRVMVDSYHDRRTGYQFAVNPAGVQRDIYISNDGDEDQSWDGVWYVATRTDAEGWSAEFRIPLSQLRYPNAKDHAFGVMISREIGRSQERDSWPVMRRSKTGFVSQFGTLDGLSDLGTPRRLEILPYSVSKNTTRIRGLGNGLQSVSHPFGQQFGADVKYGVTSNLTLDATINPDFGQVEADPAVLNLSAFEQFFPERRPFFVEGTGILRFDLDCNDGDCTGLFYSRRIGRSPHLNGSYGDETTPTFTPISAAAKLTGRLGSGLSIGVLNALTPGVQGTQRRTVEPASNYTVTRLQQDFNAGNSGVGMMFTGVNRALDQWTTSALRREAYAGGVDLRHRMFSNNYQLSAYATLSQVAGDAAAMAMTQRSGVHNFQRPDASLGYDPSATTLRGSAFKLAYSKQGGDFSRFNTSIQRTSPGFEINDLGFLPRADQQSWSTWVGLRGNNPTKVYRSGGVNFNQWNVWNTGGDLLNMGGNVNGNIELLNYIQLFGGLGVDNLNGAGDDRVARGGPLVRQSSGMFSWVGMQGDNRKAVTPAMFVQFNRGDEGRSRGISIDPNLNFRPSSRMQGSVGASYSTRINDWQWVGNIAAAQPSGATSYTFARMAQKTTSLTARMDITATRTLSLQVYAQPFITSGEFTNWRALSATPRAAQYDGRFVPYGTPGVNPDGFNFKQFRSNTVVRWEYRPGSALFVVWQHGRTQDGVNPGSFAVVRDYKDLFRVTPENTLLVKASYWFSL